MCGVCVKPSILVAYRRFHSASIFANVELLETSLEFSVSKEIEEQFLLVTVCTIFSVQRRLNERERKD